VQCAVARVRYRGIEATSWLDGEGRSEPPQQAALQRGRPPRTRQSGRGTLLTCHFVLCQGAQPARRINCSRVGFHNWPQTPASEGRPSTSTGPLTCIFVPAETDPQPEPLVLASKGQRTGRPRSNVSPLTCGFAVGLTVCWLRTSRTGVSRHTGLMSQVMPDGRSRVGHVESPASHHRDRGGGPDTGRGLCRLRGLPVLSL